MNRSVAATLDAARRSAKRKKSLLVVAGGAHPDDIELGCGAALYILARLGFTVIAVILTRGELGGNPKRRAREGILALSHLGIPRTNVFFGPFKDCHVRDSHETIEFLETFSKDVAIALIPSVHDFHEDHRYAGYACHAAFRKVPTLLAFESPSSTSEFQPSAFFAVDKDAIETKTYALSKHVTQIAKCSSLEYDAVIALSKYRGHQAGVLYAEAFETIRLVMPIPGWWSALQGNRKEVANDGKTAERTDRKGLHTRQR